MGKSTISTGPFSIATLNYQRVDNLQMKNDDFPQHTRLCFPLQEKFPHFPHILRRGEQRPRGDKRNDRDLGAKNDTPKMQNHEVNGHMGMGQNQSKPIKLLHIITILRVSRVPGFGLIAI